MHNTLKKTATYTAFDKLRTLEQGNYRLAVDYGIDRQRVRQTFRRGGSTRTKRHFTPLYESITENGVTKNLHYLTAGTGLFAIFATQTNGESAMHYTLKDHQGSLAATVCGDAVERLSYDAWGRRRNPNGFGYNHVTTTFDRGFTLHEHYDDFGLINMNGRLYDPIIGRMLSPDIAIQDEYNPQAYNRYTYCFNNPLRFTDPSGYVVQMPFEYYGLETFSYGYLGKHSFKGSSFNTEATEGMQRPEDDWYEENGRIVYDENVHSKADLKNGQKYLGKNFVKDGIYYSLFGTMTKANSKEGLLYQKIDEAFINYAEYSMDMAAFEGLSGETEPIEKQTDFGSIEKYQKNAFGGTNNIHQYNYNGVTTYLVVSDISVNKNAMKAVFAGWGDGNFIYQSNGNYNLSKSTKMDSGYNLYFVPKGNPDNYRVLMVFPTKESRASFENKWNRIFGY